MDEIGPDAGLEWENQVVLQLVQAMLGLISPAIRGVAVEFDSDKIVVHFAVSELEAPPAADIDDLIADLEGGLWPETPEVSSQMHVGSAANDSGWAGRDHRLVFLAKD